MENGKENKTGYRVEQDSIGEKDIPGDVYYGVQSLRAAENFRITGLNMHPEIINSLAYIKKASAITNCESGILEKKKAKAIVQACDEILTGKLHEYFIVDPIQGGAGTSLNMNANEVIANRAIEILGGKKGDYSAINPNDDVNCGQSTNDVIPTAGKMTSLRLLQNLKKELLRLHGALCKKAEEFDHVIKMGRTQMQDAVPIRLGQEFQAYSDAIMRDIHRMDNAMDEMRTVNMGGTAVGTGINADEAYVSRIVPNLSKQRTHADKVNTEALQTELNSQAQLYADDKNVAIETVNVKMLENDKYLTEKQAEKMQAKHLEPETYGKSESK